MRIATWNINSIRARLERVLAVLERHDLDVLTLQETKCKTEQFPIAEFEAAGYEVAAYGLNQWNGVAVLSRVGLDNVRTSFPGQPGFAKDQPSFAKDQPSFTNEQGGGQLAESLFDIGARSANSGVLEARALGVTIGTKSSSSPGEPGTGAGVGAGAGAGSSAGASSSAGKSAAAGESTSPRESAIDIWSLYVPNGRAVGDPHYWYKLEFLARLKDFAAQQLAERPQSQFALMGDWNVIPTDKDVWAPELFAGGLYASKPEREAFFSFEQAGLKEVTRPFATNYTFWDYQQLRFPRNEGMRIDYAYASPALANRVCTAVIDRDERKGKGASDHVPVIIEIDA